MVEKFAVFGGPAYLHDAGRVQGALVVPAAAASVAGVATIVSTIASVESGPDTLKGGGVAPT